MPKCKELSILNTYIKILPKNLLECKVLICTESPIKKLPNMPKCNSLLCSGTDIKTIPYLPLCHTLASFENNSKLTELSDWKIIWKLRESHNIRMEKLKNLKILLNKIIKELT